MKILVEDFNKMKTKLMEERNISSEDATQFIMKLGPKRLFKMGILEMHGWRESFTKTPIETRKERNRRKNKQARKSRRANK